MTRMHPQISKGNKLRLMVLALPTLTMPICHGQIESSSTYTSTKSASKVHRNKSAEQEQPSTNALAATEFSYSKVGLSSALHSQLSEQAKQRVQDWLGFLHKTHNLSEMAQIQAVNQYFNDMPYIDDPRAWKRSDFWATPMEVIVRNGGDCEDFAIAKYFSLRSLGISEEKLRLTFVKNFINHESHMVLDYYPDKSAAMSPLVLDNMLAEIRERHDLRAIYSFNEKTVWEGRKYTSNLGNSQQIDKWRALQKRLHQQTL